jgi:glycosyltransferase involved in cell wall biosynthesis
MHCVRNSSIALTGVHFPQVAEAGAGRIVAVDEGVIAHALRDLLSDGALRATMSANSRQLVAERFTWGAVAEGLEGVYDAAYTQV